jgi:Arc/MetJ-type ribon-helix-helix transcriptional regulator
MRPITVRLPASTVEKMDELFQRCPRIWRSRQEVLFEMIESCIQDWIEIQSKPEKTAKEFQEIARRGLQRVEDTRG